MTVKLLTTKNKATVVGGLLFAILASPEIFRITKPAVHPIINMITNQPLETDHGKITRLGVLVHAIVFMIIARLLMQIPM